MLKLRSSKYLLVSKFRTKFQLTVIILSSAINNLSECFFPLPQESVQLNALQTHHVDFTLKRRGNSRFHVVSTWNPRGVFVEWALVYK